MNNINIRLEKPQNERVLSYAPGTTEREGLKKELDRQADQVVEIPALIGGKEVRTGDLVDVTMPHDHGHVLARFHRAGEAEICAACDAAVKAQKDWMKMPWVDRASVFMKAAHLLSTRYRLKITPPQCWARARIPIRLRSIQRRKPSTSSG